MNILQIEPGFIKRNYKSILKSFLSNADIMLLMVILITSIGYVFSAIFAAIPEKIIYTPVIGALMVLQGIPAIFLIYCSMFLCARRDGQLRSSTLSIFVTSAVDTVETFKSHKKTLITNVIVFTIIYSIFIYVREGNPANHEEVNVIVQSGILYELDRLLSRFFLSIYLFGIIIKSEYSLISFYMFSSLTKRTFNTTEDGACVALKNAETINLKQSLIGLGLNQLLPLMGLLSGGTILLVPYLLSLVAMYHVWLEMFVGPGKTAESKKEAEIMEGELKPIPIKN